MAIFTKTTNTEATPGGKPNDLQALRRRHTAIEKEAAALAEATADRRAAVRQLKADHAAAHAAAQTAQRDYAAALAHRAVSKTADAPPAPGPALAHAQGLAAAIEIAEGMAADAEAAEAPARARLADARGALDHAEWQAARAEFEAGIVALMPKIAALRSATLRCGAPWFLPELKERLRDWEHAQGTAEPLGGR